MGLLEALETADGIDIDGTFIRTFNLDKFVEGFAIDINVEVEGGEINYNISLEDINEAEQLKNGTWDVEADLGDWKDTVNITAYSLTQIK